MNLPATKASHSSEDTLKALYVPRAMKMQDMNDHDSSVLDDLMAIINEEELQNLWCKRRSPPQQNTIQQNTTPQTAP